VEHGGGPAWAVALEQSGLGHAIRESLWIYPLANVLHVLAIALLLGSIVVFDLRVLGFGKGIATDRLAQLALPVAIGALCVVAPTGFALFTAEAPAYLRNPVFLIKMGLIVLALINIVVFHRGTFRTVKEWNMTGAPPAARLAAGTSLALWLCVVVAGRFIAYY
jgi:hypothetical protein